MFHQPPQLLLATTVSACITKFEQRVALCELQARSLNNNDNNSTVRQAASQWLARAVISALRVATLRPSACSRSGRCPEFNNASLTSS
jgi:hypothetical protein